MKRRDLIRYAGYGLLTSLVANKYSHPQAVLAQNNSGVTIDWLGHSCFVFRNSQGKILVNPFTPLGCTARYNQPQPQVDIVMISSRLLDEGSAAGLPNNPQLMIDAGVYDVHNIEFQGIKTLHDRENGRRFGDNIVWKWVQGGVKILHLGGIASKVGIEQKILMGTPDVLLIPVGGTAKTYNAREAIAAIDVLNPKVVIPTQYLTSAAEEGQCELDNLDEFLQLAQVEKYAIDRTGGNSITIRQSNLPSKGTVIKVLNSDRLINLG